LSRISDQVQLGRIQEVKDQHSQEQEAQQQQQQQQVQYQQPQPQQQDNEEQMSYDKHGMPLQDHSASNNTATSLHNQRNSFGNMSISEHDVSVDGMSYDGLVDNMSENGLIFDPSPATASAAPPTMEKEMKRRKKVDWDDSVLAGIIHPNRHH
jgi:transcription initiation factor TFIID subunit TAF12